LDFTEHLKSAETFDQLHIHRHFQELSLHYRPEYLSDRHIFESINCSLLRYFHQKCKTL